MALLSVPILTAIRCFPLHSEYSGSMGLVDDHSGIKTLRDITKLRKRGQSSIHAEDRIRHDEGVLKIFSPLRNGVAQSLQIPTIVDKEFPGAVATAVDQTGMIIVITKHRVIQPDESGDGTGIGRIAGWEQNG